MDRFQQEKFYQVMTNLKNRGNSRAASTKVQKDARVTEMINGLLVSKPAKEPEITILNDSWEREQGKSASIQGVNKLREIIRFQMSNGRI